MLSPLDHFICTVIFWYGYARTDYKLGILHFLPSVNQELSNEALTSLTHWLVIGEIFVVVSNNVYPAFKTCYSSKVLESSTSVNN